MKRQVRRTTVFTLAALATFVVATSQVTCQQADARPSLAVLDAMMTMVKDAVCEHYLLSGDPLPSFCPEPAACEMPVEPGPCRAYLPRWAHDPDTGRCEQFIYGGCAGNENNFPTKEACEASCVPCTADCRPHEECRLYDPCHDASCELVPYCAETCDRVRCRPGEICREVQPICVTGPCPPLAECVPEPGACDAPIDEGPCLAVIPRYGFDEASGQCVQFDWGGCAGNDNNFETLAECQAECIGDPCALPVEPGPCRAYLPRYAFDEQTGQCEAFVYGGCGGNGNNFATLQECEQTCGEVDPCSLETEVGPCLAVIPRWTFDANSGQCVEFAYGGCGGNGNNFTTREACEGTCDVRPPDPCDLEPDTGPCQAVIPRYYWDRESGQCESFDYGGCGGNDNNFADAGTCERTCGGR